MRAMAHAPRLVVRSSGRVGLAGAAVCALLPLLACAAEPRTPAGTQTSAGASAPSTTASAPALASARWSTTAAACDGVWIAPRSHCHTAETRTATLAPNELRRPYVLVLGKSLSTFSGQRIADRCVLTEEETALPPDGLELAVRVTRAETEGAPAKLEVVRADERLSVDLAACAAREIASATGSSRDAVVVFYPGDLSPNEHLYVARTGTPSIMVHLLGVGAPLTRASTLRLLQARGQDLQACFASSYASDGRVSVDVTFTLDRTGMGSAVEASSDRDDAKALATCVRRAHYNVQSTVFAEDGSTKLAVRYWFRGAPGIK